MLAEENKKYARSRLSYVWFTPKIEAFQKWEIQSHAGIVRNVWVTEKGNLLIHQRSSIQVEIAKINLSIKDKEHFKNVFYAGSHDACLLSVINKHADVCGMSSRNFDAIRL